MLNLSHREANEGKLPLFFPLSDLQRLRNLINQSAGCEEIDTLISVRRKKKKNYSLAGWQK